MSAEPWQPGERCFACVECGADVIMRDGPGRVEVHRFGRNGAPDVTLAVPKDFAIPTCEACGETYMTCPEQDELWRRWRAEELIPPRPVHGRGGF